jgi:hypothetical protein
MNNIPNVEINPAISNEVPWSDIKVTDYDERHFIVYLRLLDAAAAGASDEEMSRVVLKIDPQREPERSRKALASHLRRAQWMTEVGYRLLLHPLNS